MSPTATAPTTPTTAPAPTTNPSPTVPAAPAPPMPRTASRARQLVAASERMTLDPMQEIDWSLPIDDSTFHLPPELLPLFGTAAWNEMTERERMTYGLHEAAALCGSGIWFENVLMQVVLRHLAEIPVTDPSHRYLLVEVADECRHSTMFGEFIRRAGTPAYRPTITPHSLSGEQPVDRAIAYLLILAVEEMLDYTNRVTMRDERLHATSRAIAKLHVLEEARHVSFAKTYLSELLPALDAGDRQVVAESAAALVAVVADLSVDPAVYQHLGIDGGAEQARANPRHRAVIVAGLTKLTTFLVEVGVIDDDRALAWRELGLL